MLYLILYLTGTLQPSESYSIYWTTPDKIVFHYQLNHQRIGNFKNLLAIDPALQFAMNGAMYSSGVPSPVGLYVEKGRVVHELVRTNNSKLNFGISQCIFYIDKKGKGGIAGLDEVKESEYEFAVELAPQLIINGMVNERIMDMKSKYIRNGLGITKKGQIVLLSSNHQVTMLQFANKLKALGCESAAYIDGAVSRYWKKGMTLSGGDENFGVLIGSY